MPTGPNTSCKGRYFTNNAYLSPIPLNFNSTSGIGWYFHLQPTIDQPLANQSQPTIKIRQPTIGWLITGLVATRYLQAHSVRIKFDARCMFRGLHKDRIGWLFRGGACPEVRAFSTDQHELGWRSVSACLLERASISVCLYICIIQAGLNSLIANRSNLLYSSGKQLLPYHLPLIILRTDESSFYLPPRYAR
jgi:hypothetical protein